VGTLADGMGGAPNVLVAKMGDDKAEILKQQSRGQFIVERDQPLHLTLYDAQEPEMVMGTAPAGGTVLDTVIMVLGKENAPVRDAEVHLYGGMLPVSGITDERGLVTLSIIGEPVQSVRGLYVKPKSDYWTFYQADPVLDTSQANIVFLRALSDSFPEFPRRQTFGWGQRIMRLDQLPGNYRGQGVKIGIVDSGIATTHQDLQTIRLGFDISNKKTNPTTWSQDTVSHGSHCAGVIAGADTGIGIRGFAPDAEVHACKLFPGGQISQLIDALEYCIEKQIDLVNLSLDAIEPSEVLEQQILRAKRLGVACIVAAGNSGGAVQYPASSPNVLAVAALGRLGEFPADSYHTQTVSGVNGGGFFSPKFTCFGPEVGVCAPGVAILSSVPPNNYAVWDGTSMAASHVTGLAALVLAHHPDFQGPFKPRNSIRVDRLFQIIKSGVQPVNVGDPRRTGFGLPDVLVALGLAPRTAMMGAPPVGLFGNFPPFAPAALYGGGLGAFAFGPTGFAFGPSPYHQPQVPVGVW
jgi:subtilisin family serine protease